MVLDDGLTATTTSGSADVSRAVRTDLVQHVGFHGVEFVAWGEADLRMAVGVLTANASLSAMVGGDAYGVGWRLDTGEIHSAGVVVADGLDVPAKGDILGVRVDFLANTVAFYRGADLVHTQPLPVLNVSWYAAVSLGSDVAGELACALNAGQWIAASDAAAAGWALEPDAGISVRLADVDWIAPHDAGAYLLTEAGGWVLTEDGLPILLASHAVPPNAQYAGRVDVSGITTFAEMSFWPWGGGAAGGGVAQVPLLDPDGALDDIAAANIDGLHVELRTAAADGTTAQLARYRAARLEAIDDVRKVLHLRDAHDALDEPIARAVFLPNLPALAWQPVPVAIGAVASVPAKAATADGSVAFLCDAPIVEAAAVLDRGDPLDAADWALDPSKQQLLLANAPIGPVVADVSTVGVNMTPATLWAALADVFGRVGISAWSADDADAIDTATGYAGIGYYDATQQPARDTLVRILPSYGASWYADPSGTLRIVRAIDPDSVDDADLAFDLIAAHLTEDLQRVPDEAPNLTRRMAYRPNAFVHGAGDLVTDLEDVPPQRRLELTASYRGQVYSSLPLAPRYAHADAAPPIISCFWNAADAQAEIDRVCALYAVQRFFYRWPVNDPDLAPEPGQVGRITFPRYGLEAGRKVLVRSVERNPSTGDVVLTLWGA